MESLIVSFFPDPSFPLYVFFCIIFLLEYVIQTKDTNQNVGQYAILLLLLLFIIQTEEGEVEKCR